MIKVENLVKKYYKDKLERTVLKGLTFEVEKGDFTAIIGPSGSGKSTLLYTLSGLENYLGSIKINNKEINELSKKDLTNLRKNEIGFVFQFFNLLEHLTVYENLRLAYLISDKKGYSVEEVLKLVGMENYQNYFPHELSGGMQQRIAVARSILGSKEIIFADEPTGNLDLASSYEIMELFKTLNVELGITIVLVTHNDLLLKYVNKTIKLIDGEINE